MQKQKQSPNNILGSTKGLTLIEIMVSLAIVGILASIGMPSFVEMIKKRRTEAVRDELLASIQTAQTEAIRHGKSVRLVRTEKTANCERTLADANDWSCGWQSRVDTKILQTFTVPSGYVVSQPSKGQELTLNRWGQALDTTTFVINHASDGLSGKATKTICVLRGNRIIKKDGVANIVVNSGVSTCE